MAEGLTRRQLTWIAVAGLIVLFCSQMGKNSSRTNSTSGTTTTTLTPAPSTTKTDSARSTSGYKEIEWGRTYTTVEGTPACTDDKHYAEFMGYFRNKEEQPLREMINSGDCILLKGHQKVLPVKRTGSMWDAYNLVIVRFVNTRQTAVVDAGVALAEVK